MLAVTLPLDRDLGLGTPGVPARGADVCHRPSRSGSDEPRDIRRLGAASPVISEPAQVMQIWVLYARQAWLAGAAG